VRILVVGTGGREHALALKLSQEGNEVYAAPGNPGIAEFATLQDVDIMSGPEIASLAGELGADLVVVGPEAPLVAGVADAVRDAGIAVFGPSQAAAQLEGSKAFSKDVMSAAGVPTAGSRVATTPTKSWITTTSTMPGMCATDVRSTDFRLAPTIGPLSRPA
jgi:phosphoribosylamine--glycine ligase